MKRAQIYLDAGEYEALREAAFKQRRSISSVLRHLIQVSIVGGQKKPRAGKKLLDDIIGILHDSKTDVAKRHDHYLWDEDA